MMLVMMMMAMITMTHRIIEIPKKLHSGIKRAKRITLSEIETDWIGKTATQQRLRLVYMIISLNIYVRTEYTHITYCCVMLYNVCRLVYLHF